jgi:hypothetical protein
LTIGFSTTGRQSSFANVPPSADSNVHSPPPVKSPESAILIRRGRSHSTGRGGPASPVTERKTSPHQLGYSSCSPMMS